MKEGGQGIKEYKRIYINNINYIDDVQNQRKKKFLVLTTGNTIDYTLLA